MFKIRRLYSIPLLLCGLLATEAYGNGINPPRPRGGKTVEAICTDRMSGNATTVQRARITMDETSGDEPSGSIELRVGKSTASTHQLSHVIRVQIPSAGPTLDGFTEASLELSDPSYKGSGFIRVRAKGKPVRLTGFKVNLDRVDIPLETCKELALKAFTSSGVEREEVTAD